MQINPAKTFVLWFAGSVFACGLLILALVILIDPYNLYGWVKKDGVNRIKPELSRYASEIKLSQALKLKPDTFIFGNSRAEIGFDPDSAEFIRQGYSAYNFAIRGSSLNTAYEQLSYLTHKGLRPKKILLAMEFIDFMNASKNMATPDGQPKLKPIDYAVEHWFWRFDNLFSMTAVSDAVKTLRIQHDDEAGVVTDRGYVPLKQYQTLARNEGYYVLFRQRAEENAVTYLKKVAGGYDKTDFSYFRAMLSDAADAGSEVIVIIYPYHAQIMSLFAETGALPFFAQWKADLIAEVEQSAKPDSIKVLDYSGYSQYQCEKIPAKGDLGSSTQWYWEAGHFKKALGEIMLSQILNPTTDRSRFGFLLNRNTLAENQQRMSEEQAACNANYPTLFTDTKALVNTSRNNQQSR